ncbi:hypothetical protein [Ruminococcus flavefaciens]|uniref:hypothetical protein n=1 Tax=Ruminococcus flavefaciens TaxID=1265 RepID=UPI0026EE69ED|nr:hypothetical protein [Ruminococcus flavefaciens]
MTKEPKFIDFLESLTPEKLSEVQKKAKIDISSLEEKDSNNVFAVFREFISKENFLTILGLLELYHQWLVEELKKD